MKFHFKRAAAFVLAATMLTGVFSACSTNTESSSAALPASSAQMESGRYSEPVSLEWAVAADAAQKFGEGQSYDANVWTDLIKEKLNIDLSVAWSADATTGAYAEKLRMVLASEELPDLFNAYYEEFKMAMDGGLLADLTDAVEQYGSDKLKQIMAENPDLFDACSRDGRLYALPLIGSATELTASQLWIRQDWLDNLGLQAPSTWDELVEVARAFTFDDPDGNGVDDTFGLGLVGGLNWGGVGYFEGIAAAFHAYGSTTWIRTDEGRIEYGGVQPEMKDALAAAHALYAEGIIDTEFGSKPTEKLVEDIYNNKIGMFFGENYVGYWPLQTLVDEDPNAVFVACPFVSADDEQPDAPVRWPVDSYNCVSADCANPEAAVLIANLYLETVNENADAATLETYEYSGDISSYMLCPVRMSDPGFEFRVTEAIEKARSGDTSALSSKGEIYWEKVQAYEGGDSSCYNYWSQVGPMGSIPVIQQYIDNGQIYLTWKRGGTPEGFESISSTLYDKEVEAFSKIITGALSVDDFDTFAEQWYNEGGADLTEAMNETYGSLPE